MKLKIIGEYLEDGTLKKILHPISFKIDGEIKWKMM
jgi:hypothetical protein